MTFVHGKATRVLVNGYDLSGVLNQASASIMGEAPEATVFTSAAKEYQPGLTDGTVSLEGFVDEDPDDGGPLLSLEDRLATWIGTAGVALFYPGGVDTLGAPGRACAFYQASHDVESPVEGLNSLSVELQTTAGLRPVRALANLTARTTTNQGSADDSGIVGGTAYGGEAFLEVTAGSPSAGSLIAKVQGSADGSTGWADLATFTTVLGSDCPIGLKATWAGSTPRYLRAQWTIAGSGPSFTFTLAAHRRLVAA